MDYTITSKQIRTSTKGAPVWLVTATVGSIEGHIEVVCATKEEAEKYAEDVFLVDLRHNNPSTLGGLVLPIDGVS